jgi:hypothetical protein
MSEIWKKCEGKVEELRRKLGTQHSSNSDLIFQEVVGQVREKGIVAKPIINNQRIKLIEYVLPGRPTSKMMGIMYGIIAKEKNVSRLDYKVDENGNLTDIFAYDENQLLLHLYEEEDKIRILCYRKDAARIVDKIKEEFR